MCRLSRLRSFDLMHLLSRSQAQWAIGRHPSPSFNIMYNCNSNLQSTNAAFFRQVFLSSPQSWSHSPRGWSICANQGRNDLSSLLPEIRNAVFYKLASGVVSGNLSQETRVQPVVIGEALTLWLDEEGRLKLPMPRASDLLQTV